MMKKRSDALSAAGRYSSRASLIFVSFSLASRCYRRYTQGTKLNLTVFVWVTIYQIHRGNKHVLINSSTLNTRIHFTRKTLFSVAAVEFFLSIHQDKPFLQQLDVVNSTVAHRDIKSLIGLQWYRRLLNKLNCSRGLLYQALNTSPQHPPTPARDRPSCGFLSSSSSHWQQGRR